MLEIIMLIRLTRVIGKMLEEKGRKAGWFKFLTVVLWFGGEIVGGIMGGIIAALNGWNNLIAYLFALIGAAVGAGTAYMIARSMPPLVIAPPPPPPTFR